MPGGPDCALFPREFFESTLRELAAEYSKESEDGQPPRVVPYLSNGNTVVVKRVRALESERMLVEGEFRFAPE